jgi:hypothetical protein
VTDGLNFFWYSSARDFTRRDHKGEEDKAMAMEIILDLQKLEVPQEEDLFGSSTGSSTKDCCNGAN